MVTSTACLKASTSNLPSALRYFIRFSDARLHAVSSRNMYSEQGLLALMRAVLLQVCQRLTVVSYCMPGSPQCQVESAIFIIRRARGARPPAWPPPPSFAHPPCHSTPP